jgi:hypothetical protein
MAYIPKLSNDVTFKETNKTFYSLTAYSVSDFKLTALQTRLTGIPVEYWGPHYDGPPPK